MYNHLSFEREANKNILHGKKKLVFVVIIIPRKLALPIFTKSEGS